VTKTGSEFGTRGLNTETGMWKAAKVVVLEANENGMVTQSGILLEPPPSLS
jgi:hypothetical protein